MKHNLVTFIALTALVLCSVIFWQSGYVEYILGGIVILYLGIVAYGSSQIQSNYFVKSINLGKNKGIALTFDDGPDPDTTPQILTILKNSGIKATFFVIGKKAEQYPELLRQMDHDGHIIGNHSFSHHYGIGFFSTSKLSADLEHCNDVIKKAIGKTPAFFRPPFGVTNPRYEKALKANNLTSIGWSVRSLDTKAKNKYEVIDKVISKLKKRDIVLLHDHLPVTVDALTDIIELCRNRKLNFEPLSKVINQEPYVKS